MLLDAPGPNAEVELVLAKKPVVQEVMLKQSYRPRLILETGVLEADADETELPHLDSLVERLIKTK